MSDLIVNSFFTSGGSPLTGLSPTIRIWEINTAGENLVIGAPNGSISAVDGVMTEIIDGVSADAFYKFVFLQTSGYDPTKRYIFRIDGGITVPTGERFQAGETEEMSVTSEVVTDIVNGTWDEATATHLLAGSFGELIQLIKADTTAIFLCCELVRKFSTNRTKIDITANTLTIFDDDKTTVLHVFNLKDGGGIPSSNPVCERDPL